MSEITDLFDRLAIPALAERAGDPATLRVAGSLSNTVAITVIVDREQDQSVHQTTSTPNGRNVNNNVFLDVLTPAVRVGVNDAIVLADGEVAQVIRVIHSDPDGSYPRLLCNVPGSITSKVSQARQ
jgi:hypothetical protein